MPSTCAARQRGEGGRRRHTHLLLEGRHPALARRGHAHGRRGRLQAAHLVCACLLGAGRAVAEALLLVLCLANKRAVSSGRASTRATTYAHRGESVTPAGHRVRQEEAGISVGVYIAWGLRLNAASVHKGGDHVERGGGEQRASKWRVVHSQHPLFFLLHPVLAQPGSTAVYS
jgi:hypothetical protein